MEDKLTTQLSATEKAELETLEGIIKREMGSFVAVGNALLAIRDRRLYREQFRSFADYCNTQWGVGPRYARNLISGSQVAANLTQIGSPGSTLCAPCEIQPIYEKQVRPLTVLEPEQQCEVWEEAVRSADGKVVTYKQVKALVTKLIGPAPPPPKPKAHPPFSNAVLIVHTAIAHLEGILDDDPRREEAFQMLLSWIDKNRKRRTR